MVGPMYEALSARDGLAYPKICGYICGICLEWKGESQAHADAWTVRKYDKQVPFQYNQENIQQEENK